MIKVVGSGLGGHGSSLGDGLMYGKGEPGLDFFFSATINSRKKKEPAG